MNTQGVHFKKIIFLGALTLTFFFAISSFYVMHVSKHPNVILIVIDALRPDHLGCYGYQRNTSPNIDKLAKQGVIFKQAISSGGWTWESVPSILTGVYPSTHHIKDWKNNSLNPYVKTLPRILKQINMYSALFSDTPALEILDIKDGFDSVCIEEDRLNLRELTDWLKENKEKSFFMYIHFIGAHAPYSVSKSYYSGYLSDIYRIRKEIPISKKPDVKNEGREYKGLGKIPYIVAQQNISDIDYYIAKYDGAISFMDSLIGNLMEELKLLRLLNNTIIIITSDHGESLGEHNIYFDHATCYEEDIRVPLIIRFPSLFPRGRIISQQVSLVDLVPTILNIMRINIPPYIQGKSLLKAVKNKEINLHPYVYISAPGYGRLQSSIRSGEWKLIKIANSFELYNLASDPGESRNLIDEKQSKLEEFEEILRLYARGENASPLQEKNASLTDKQINALKSLGYLQ